MTEGIVYSICIAAERGQLKHEVAEAHLIEDFGIENDGHAGDWGRQVTCLAWESVERINQEKNMQIGPGQFAENLLIKGLDLTAVGAGGRLRIGDDVVLEVSQIGKEDHPSIVTRTFGVSLLPHEGLFCRIINGGHIKKGDQVEVLADV